MISFFIRRMKLKLSPLLACLMALSSVFISHATDATEIKGTISFLKKPPLVGIAYIPSQAENDRMAEIDQVDKQFTSKMAVVKPGQSVTFKNSDDVDHNVFANDPKQMAKFDVGLMQPGGEKEITVDWEEESIVRVGCKIHPKMRTYLTALNTPFFKVIEFTKGTSEYTFNLEQVPADAAKLIFRIPKYDPIEIDLTQGNSWQLDITKKGKTRGAITVSKI